jgi:hypothetical protein
MNGKLLGKTPLIRAPIPLDQYVEFDFVYPDGRVQGGGGYMGKSSPEERPAGRTNPDKGRTKLPRR